MAELQNTLSIRVDFSFSESERRLIARRFIEYIVDRTKAGRGLNGKSFGNYSKSYTETDEFEIAGKRPGRVNLTLTGDMLDSIKVLDIAAPGRIIIGYEEGEENDKSVWMREKGYDFLIISDAERDKVLEEFKSASQTTRLTETISPSIANSFLRRLFRG